MTSKTKNMANLNITGSLYNASGMTSTFQIFDANNDLVWESYPGGNFNVNVPLTDGASYALDLGGYSQGSLVLTLAGYTSIDHNPAAQYNKRLSDDFNLQM
ncbi:MAG: hypothetical protein JWP45_2906 [Mucilaginibacter sp.]|nr:hypothetical protein [Mucilaginibacter sp.]